MKSANFMSSTFPAPRRIAEKNGTNKRWKRRGRRAACVMMVLDLLFTELSLVDATERGVTTAITRYQHRAAWDCGSAVTMTNGCFELTNSHKERANNTCFTPIPKTIELCKEKINHGICGSRTPERRNIKSHRFPAPQGVNPYSL